MTKVDYDFKFDSVNPAKVEGMGKEVEIVANEAGGKQSNIPYAFHLIDPGFLLAFIDMMPEVVAHDRLDDIHETLLSIKDYMITSNRNNLVHAIQQLGYGLDSLFEIAKVLKQGADKYEANNWRLIPAESHLSHAIAHLLAYATGDEQDDHIPHAMCRLMMAYVTNESNGFVYTKYIPKDSCEHLPCYCR